jgi:aubergine
MVVGYNVYHDTEKKGTSVVALFCSLNKTFTKYYSEVDYHSSNTEVSNNVNSSLMNGLAKYQQENKCLPVRIFIYRDGVGEGQIQFVYKHELRAMREALKSFGP